MCKFKVFVIIFKVQLDGQCPSSREMNRIRELLQEELNFEIINYPTPPQYSMSRKGHKKVIKKKFLCSKTSHSSRLGP